MLGFGRLRCLSLYFCFVVGAFGCAADGPTRGGSEGGSLSLELMIADGIEIDEVSWRISGDNMDDMMGVIDTGAPGATASVEVAGIPEGQNNLIEMEATSTDGETTCQGSANFDVTAGEVTEVYMMLRCKAPQRFGGVRVNGKFNLCAELTMVVAAPMQTSVGNDIQLYTTAVDEEDDPISYLWTSVMGSIAEPTAQRTTYTCTEVGDDLITITASDDGAIFCMSDWTVPVTCVPGDGDPCEGVTCEDDGNDCTRTDCNPASVQCETSNVNDGISCNGGEGTCSNGQCVESDLCADVTCPDLGECRTSTCNPNTGTCEPSNVSDGTSCNSGDGTCMNGACVDLNLCAGVTCPDLGECQSNVCNPNTGQCEASDVSNGTSCNGGGGMCIDGTCANADLCMGVTCPSLGDCVDNVCNPSSGACESSTAPDGTTCNGGAGVCMSGSCDLAATTVSIEFGGPLAVFIDQQFDYTIDLTNTGSEPASNVVVVVTLPGAGSLVSSDPAGALGPGTLTMAFGDLGPGESASGTMTWLAPSIGTVLFSSAQVNADNAPAVSDQHVVDAGTQTVVTGGATAGGTGLRHRDSGDIRITGVPSGATVTRAVLVWASLFQGAVPNNEITFEGVRIVADLTQTIGFDVCWGEANTVGFAADVTDLVSGNGFYAVTDPVNAIIRVDNDPSPTFPLTDGASLVVFYGGPGFDDLVFSDFSYSAENNSPFGFQNVRTIQNIPSVGGQATLILAGPDGQRNFSEMVEVVGASSINYNNAWAGSDPQMGPTFFVNGQPIGNLWDTLFRNVTNLLPAGQSTLTINLGDGEDCTGVSAVVLQIAQ